MVSKLELKVKELDDESEKIRVAARRIAEQLNHKEGYIFNILIAKRQGCKSYTKYKRRNQKGHGFKREIDYRNFLAKRNNHANHDSYLDSLAVNNGLIDRNEYKAFRDMRKKGKYLTLRDYQERGAEIKGEYRNPEFFYRLSCDRLSIEQSTKLLQINSTMYEIVFQLVDKLEPKYRKVIQDRFFKQKTLEKIGKKLNITRERVRQIESEALKKLYSLAKQSGLNELYFSRGEII